MEIGLRFLLLFLLLHLLRLFALVLGLSLSWFPCDQSLLVKFDIFPDKNLPLRLIKQTVSFSRQAIANKAHLLRFLVQLSSLVVWNVDVGHASEYS